MITLLPNKIVTRRDIAKRKEENNITCQEEERVFHPQKKSRVGRRYQATDLPVAGTYESEKDTETACYDQVWDPAKAVAAGYLDFVHRTATHNKKEAGMLLFNKRGYNVSGFCDDLAEADTLDGSDWSHEEKVSFHKLIVAHHKDFGRVAKSMGKSRNNCLAYYYGKYKTPADYVELKRVMIRFKRRKVALARGEIVCTSCAYGGGDLLNCVTCKNYYHAKCVTSPPSSVNGAKWYCDECVAKRRRPVTRSSIGKRKLNRNSKGNEKKRSAVAQSSSFHVGRRFSRRLQAPLELCLMV